MQDDAGVCVGVCVCVCVCESVFADLCYESSRRFFN